MDYQRIFKVLFSTEEVGFKMWTILIRIKKALIIGKFKAAIYQLFNEKKFYNVSEVLDF